MARTLTTATGVARCARLGAGGGPALTVTTSYEEAAAMRRDWGHAVDDSTLHALAQRLGARAQQQTEARLARPAVEQEPQRGASALGVLMLEGWPRRQRRRSSDRPFFGKEEGRMKNEKKCSVSSVQCSENERAAFRPEH